MPNEEPEVLFARRGTAGIVTLNRPAALNAVTLGMVRLLHAQLAAWRDDPAVTRVLVTAVGGRAFSAGGDLRGLYEAARAGRQQESLAFWREEYRLNAAIKHYPKPYVALLDGIVMGGGAGLSVHGSHRVAGDKFLFAMPEVGIGFFPDVGATWFLPRFPGELGAYCALTGERLKPADGIAAGVATHHVASARFGDLLDALTGAAPVDALLGAFAEPVGQGQGPEKGEIAARSAAIARLFAGDRVEDILARLDTQASSASTDAAWAGAVAATIRSKAPRSLKLALAQVRRGRDWSFDDCMRAEWRIVSRLVYGEDFYEGIRAVIIDKDNRPRWRPASLAEVTPAEVDRHFAPVAQELALP
jgi:enoyl-CoA hydratase/carnithine racemase